MAHYIVTISVSYNNARKVCETIENMSFNTLTELREFINKLLDLVEDENPQFLDLSDFMDEVNNEYFDSANYFISYVRIGK